MYNLKAFHWQKQKNKRKRKRGRERTGRGEKLSNSYEQYYKILLKAIWKDKPSWIGKLWRNFYK